MAVTAFPRAKRAGDDESHAREATEGSDPERLVCIRIRAGPFSPHFATASDGSVVAPAGERIFAASAGGSRRERLVNPNSSRVAFRQPPSCKAADGTESGPKRGGEQQSEEHRGGGNDPQSALANGG